MIIPRSTSPNPTFAISRTGFTDGTESGAFPQEPCIFCSDADSAGTSLRRPLTYIFGQALSSSRAMAVPYGHVQSCARVGLHTRHQSTCACAWRLFRVEVSNQNSILKAFGTRKSSGERHAWLQSFDKRSLLPGTSSMHNLRLMRDTALLSVSSDSGATYTRQKRNAVVAAYRKDDPLHLLSNYVEDGPIELGPKEIDVDPFAVPEASVPQIIASILLTGTIAVLSFRALRKRARRAKDMQFRSSGVSSSKSTKEEARRAALASLTKSPEILEQPPTAAQTALGAIVAGVIALGLYKFTTLVEGGFSGKAVSQDYSIRNLTITVRTIITGLCYLATFVFAANSIGLSLYALQLLLGINVSDPQPSKTDLNEKEESAPLDQFEAEDVKED